MTLIFTTPAENNDQTIEGIQLHQVHDRLALQYVGPFQWFGVAVLNPEQAQALGLALVKQAYKLNPSGSLPEGDYSI
jgi:hypothetical protein